MAKRCKFSPLVTGEVSPTYINKLEHGIDVAISPEILLMLKDVLLISYDELLSHLTEKNYIRFSNYLKDKQIARVRELGPTDKTEEWRAFLQQANGISRKIIEPLLWELSNRDIIGCELIPYTWPEDFWAGTTGIKELGECMASLAEIYDSLADIDDRVALALRAAIEDSLGNQYIRVQRTRRKKFERGLKKDIILGRKNTKKNKF